MKTFMVASAAAALERLPRLDRERMRVKLKALASEPRPPDSKAMHGGKRETRRVRVGDYRAIYEIEATGRVVVITVAHRREVYRDF